MFLEERIAVLERQMKLLGDVIHNLQVDLEHLSTMRSSSPAQTLPDKPALTTKEAAYLLNRTPQTLRVWAMYENGPVRPQRINRRLLWATADIIKLIAHGDP